MAMEESFYKKLFWIVVPACVTAVGVGAVSLIVMSEQMKSVKTELADLKSQLTAMQASQSVLTMMQSQLHDQIRTNTDQEKRIQTLEVWRARVDERMQIGDRPPR